MKTYSEIGGHLASVMVILAYFLLANGSIGSTWYMVWSLMAGVILGLHGWERRSRPLVLLNSATVLISLFGIARALLA